MQILIFLRWSNIPLDSLEKKVLDWYWFIFVENDCFYVGFEPKSPLNSRFFTEHNELAAHYLEKVTTARGM